MWPKCVVSQLATIVDKETADVNITECITLCYDKFISQTPFLKDLPKDYFLRPSKAKYLPFAMASIGAAIAGEPPNKSKAFWSGAIRLLVWQLEVDNREARKMDLIDAVCLSSSTLGSMSSTDAEYKWILLETYGHISSNKVTWSHTTMAHGYVETVSTLDRSCVFSS